MIASAPGKIILFGEHAVVYKRHALVSAISLRCYVEVEKSNDFKITSPLGKTRLDFKVHPYVSYAVKRFCEYKNISGAEIRIRSEIPISSGLGSSSAVTVATLKALSEEFEAGLSNEEIFEIAKAVELDVQGRASGTDPFVSTFGGSWLIPERRKAEIPYSLFIVVLGEKSTAEMVKKVAELRERHSDIIEKIFDAIDSITIKAYRNLNDLKILEELISINQSLLRAIGVSTPEIDKKIAEFEEKGFRVKITGAGGGGCIFGIAKDNAPGIIVKCNEEGVRIEDS